MISNLDILADHIGCSVDKAIVDGDRLLEVDVADCFVQPLILREDEYFILGDFCEAMLKLSKLFIDCKKFAKLVAASLLATHEVQS